MPPFPGEHLVQDLSLPNLLYDLLSELLDADRLGLIPHGAARVVHNVDVLGDLGDHLGAVDLLLEEVEAAEEVDAQVEHEGVALEVAEMVGEEAREETAEEGLEEGVEALAFEGTQEGLGGGEEFESEGVVEGGEVGVEEGFV